MSKNTYIIFKWVDCLGTLNAVLRVLYSIYIPRHTDKGRKENSTEPDIFHA